MKIEIQCPCCQEIIEIDDFCDWTDCPHCHEAEYRIMDEWQSKKEVIK